MEPSVRRVEIVVAGFGSPHGDDRTGWELATRLARRPNVEARVLCVGEGTELLHGLSGCERLILVDACRGSGPPGTITRYVWPDPRIRRHHDRSTHQFGLTSALELAKQLGRLPAEVVVFGIEGQRDETVGPLTGEVSQVLDELEAIVLREIERGAYA
jgi:hydrogenase maturation protease